MDPFHTVSAALARHLVEKLVFPLPELIFEPYARYTRRVTGFVSMEPARKPLNQPNIVCGYLHRPLNPPTAEVERERGLWELPPPNPRWRPGIGGANCLFPRPGPGRGGVGSTVSGQVQMMCQVSPDTIRPYPMRKKTFILLSTR